MIVLLWPQSGMLMTGISQTTLFTSKQETFKGQKIALILPVTIVYHFLQVCCAKFQVCYHFCLVSDPEATQGRDHVNNLTRIVYLSLSLSLS